MAFDPGFTDYRAEPNGGYTFAHPDGRQLFFHGPEADRIAQDIDRTRPADMRTAGLGSTGLGFGPASAGTADAIRGFSEQPPPREAPQAHAAPAPVSDPRDMGPTTAPSPNDVPPPAPVAGPQPGGAAPPQYVSSTGYPTGSNGDPLFPQPTEISMYKRTAARPGGYMPTAQSQTTEGAKEYSPGLIKGFENTHEAEHSAIAQGYGAQHAAYKSALEAAEAERSALETEALNAQIKKDIIRRDVEAARTNLDQLSQDASEAKVDGGSIWGNGSGKDAAGGMLTLISAALTSMGSAILGRGPSGMDVINNRIAQDVAAQRAEVQRKGIKANNALAQYQRVFGDMDTAETALKAVQTRTAATMAQKQAAIMGDANAQQAAMQMAIAADKKYLEHAQQLEENVQGKTIQKLDAKYQAPSAGGSIRKTPQEIKAEVGAAEAVLDYNNKALGRAKPGAEEQNAARQQEEYELKRQVILPTGQKAYVGDDRITQNIQMQIDATDRFKKNVDEQRKILGQLGSSIDPAAAARYKQLVKNNTVLVRDFEVLKNLTDGDYVLVDPFTGAGGNDISLDPTKKTTVLAGMREAQQHAQFREDSAYKLLFKDPSTKTPVKPTTSGAGITVDGAISNPSAEEPPVPLASR